MLNGGVQPGDTIAVVGAGPIGLATIMTAKLFTPSKIIAIDLAEARLEKALEFGADIAIDNGREDAIARVMELTNGLGVDVAVEAVGVPETFELCTSIVRPGGRVANVGVHGHSATLHLETLWIRDVTITTGLVDTLTTPQLMRLIEERGSTRRRSRRTGSGCRRRRRRTTSSPPRPRRTPSRSCSRRSRYGFCRSTRPCPRSHSSRRIGVAGAGAVPRYPLRRAERPLEERLERGRHVVGAVRVQCIRLGARGHSDHRHADAARRRRRRRRCGSVRRHVQAIRPARRRQRAANRVPGVSGGSASASCSHRHERRSGPQVPQARASERRWCWQTPRRVPCAPRPAAWR